MSYVDAKNLNLAGNVYLGGTQVNSTAAELNLVDGATTVGNTVVADGHGIVMNHNGTMAQTSVEALAAYLDDEITEMPNLVRTGTIGTGVWQGAAIADEYVADDLTISGGTVNNSVIGGSTPAAGTFTTLTANTLTANTSLEVSGADGITLGGGMSTSAISFKESSANGSNYIALKAPDAVTTNQTFTLPDADGSSGQVLSTNGSGVLSWVTNSSASTTVSNSDIHANYRVVFHDGSNNLLDDDGALEYNPGTGLLMAPSLSIGPSEDTRIRFVNFNETITSGSQASATVFNSQGLSETLASESIKSLMITAKINVFSTGNYYRTYTISAVYSPSFIGTTPTIGSLTLKGTTNNFAAGDLYSDIFIDNDLDLTTSSGNVTLTSGNVNNTVHIRGLCEVIFVTS